MTQRQTDSQGEDTFIYSPWDDSIVEDNHAHIPFPRERTDCTIVRAGGSQKKDYS